MGTLAQQLKQEGLQEGRYEIAKSLLGACKLFCVNAELGKSAVEFDSESEPVNYFV